MTAVLDKSGGKADGKPEKPVKSEAKPARPSDRAVFSTMPGWGVVVDLTPRELVDARKLRTLKRLIALGLLLVVIACGAGFAYAVKQDNDAAADANSAVGDTAILQQQQAGLSGIVQIQDAVQQIKTEVGSVMGSDANVPKALSTLRTSLPAGSKLNTVTLMLDAPGQAVADGGAGDMNLTGQTEIGTLTITGVARELTDTAVYADRLRNVPAFVNVVGTNADVAQDGHYAFTVSITLGSALLTQRYTPSTPSASDPAVSSTSSAPATSTTGG